MHHSTPTRRQYAIAAICAFVSLALAGCGGGDASADEPVGGAPAGAGPVATAPTSVDYGAAAKPLDVAAVLDATAVQELDVPIAGATLSVTGANGTRYTLLVPGNALRSPTRIRMQAVSALTGVPAGIEAVHGVQLEPRGLHFMAPATLTIEPAVAVPLDRQAFYAYAGTGRDMHPMPGELGATAQVKVMHFSGYGMATLLRERSVSGVFVDVVPAGLEARLRAATAQAFMDARAGTITSQQLAAAVDALLTQYEREVLRLMHNSASRSCANALTAFSAELGNARQRQLLGFAETSSTDAKDTLKTLRSVCFEEANQRCRVSGNIQELIVAHLGIERQVQLLGATDPAATAREETAIDKCGRYEFQFDSTVTYDGVTIPSPVGFGRLTVTTRVPIKLSASISDGLEGDAAIDYTETLTRFNCPGLGCGYYLVQLTHPDKAIVKKGLPKFSPLQGIDVWALGQPVAQTGTFSVEFDPGELGEDVDVLVNVGPLGVINVNQQAGLPPTKLQFWSAFYSLVNQSEVGPSGFYVWADEWKPIAYPVMFERSKAPSQENPAFRLVATTKARLVHKPI